MSSFQIKKAVRAGLRVRMAIEGPSGAGKTWSALALGEALAAGGPLVVIDSERASASRYADVFSFDVAELSESTGLYPKVYREALYACAAAGYPVVVIDSLTHAWAWTLNLKDEIASAAKTKSGKADGFAAWSKAGPEWDHLILAILDYPGHVVATMRAKTEYARDDSGKVEKLGLAPVVRDGTEYEFDLVASVGMDHRLSIGKSRAQALSGFVTPPPSSPEHGRRQMHELGTQLLAWAGGAPAVESRAPGPAGSPPPAATTSTASPATAAPAPATAAPAPATAAPAPAPEPDPDTLRLLMAAGIADVHARALAALKADEVIPPPLLKDLSAWLQAKLGDEAKSAWKGAKLGRAPAAAALVAFIAAKFPAAVKAATPNASTLALLLDVGVDEALARKVALHAWEGPLTYDLAKPVADWLRSRVGEAAEPRWEKAELGRNPTPSALCKAILDGLAELPEEDDGGGGLFPTDDPPPATGG